MSSTSTGDSPDPKRAPTIPPPDRRPLLKKSRTISDTTTTIPHFPGPLFPTVRRVPPSSDNSPTWSPRRSFDSSDSSTTTNSDTFPGQTFGFSDRDYVYPSFLGPNTTRNRVTVVKPMLNKSVRKQPPVSSSSGSGSSVLAHRGRSDTMGNNLVGLGEVGTQSVVRTRLTSSNVSVVESGSESVVKRVADNVSVASLNSSSNLVSSMPVRKTVRVRSSLMHNVVSQ